MALDAQIDSVLEILETDERRDGEYSILEGTGLTLEQLMEELHAYLLASAMDPQQSFLQPGPEHSKTQPQTVTKHLEVRLCPIGLFDGKMIYGAPGDRVPPPVNACSPQKRKLVSQQEDERPYAKKLPKRLRVRKGAESKRLPSTPSLDRCGGRYPKRSRTNIMRSVPG